MSAFIVGLITGFLVVIPIGPINVSVMTTSLKRRPGGAFAIGSGGSIMDVTYFYIILKGFSLFSPDGTLALVLQIAGIVFLIGFGIVILRSPLPDMAKNPPSAANGKTVVGFFLLGVFLYISNPALIFTLSGVIATITSWSLLPETASSHVLFCAGAGIGSICWYGLLVLMTVRMREFMTGKALYSVNRGCGILLLFFALYMGLTLVR